MTKVGITGSKGRMGQLLIEEVNASNALNFSGGVDKDDTAAPLFEQSDIIIDFTIPEATMQHLALAATNKTGMVIGTTGLSAEDEAKLANFAKDIPIMYAANMSVGVNMLMALVEQTAARLGTEWDIEVFETHHHHKIDSPSGTALALGKSAQSGRNGGDFIVDRVGKRNQGDIGYAVQRGGDVVGEHDVTFFGTGERITLGHMATDRRLFARGAIHASTWLADKPAGLYSMRDVLDL